MSESSDDEGEVNSVNLCALQENLSPATLAALMQFLPNRRFEDECDEVNDVNTKVSDASVCVAYTPKDVNVIAETFKRLASTNAEKDTHRELMAESRKLLQLEASLPLNAYETLLREGFVRLVRCVLQSILIPSNFT